MWLLANKPKYPAVTPSIVHIIRHGQALHNVERGYPHRDPPLTADGQSDTKAIKLPAVPDLIVVSPMTRTIQTAINVFSSTPGSGKIAPQIEVQIWLDLRESHDANCNKGLSKRELLEKFPEFDFEECSEEWDYPPHSIGEATKRAERVRQRLKELSKIYHNIAMITHRGFIAFLVKGEQYAVCERRSYRFATENDAKMTVNSAKIGVHVDTKDIYNFGPTVLIPIEPNASPIKCENEIEDKCSVWSGELRQCICESMCSTGIDEKN